MAAERKSAAEIISDLERSVGGISADVPLLDDLSHPATATATPVTPAKLTGSDITESLRAVFDPIPPSVLPSVSGAVPSSAIEVAKSLPFPVLDAGELSPSALKSVMEGLASGGAGAGPRIAVDPVMLVHTKILELAELERVCELLEGIDEDEFSRSKIDVFDPPIGFVSVSEVLLHPTFVRHSITSYDCAYLVDPDNVRRIHTGGDSPTPRIEITDIKDGKEVAEPTFFLKPDWYDTLVALVDRGSTILLIGPAGCISWDTHIGYVVRDLEGILVNKKGGTLERLYQRFNNVPQPGVEPRWRTDVNFFVQSVADDGVVRLNRIDAVIDSGVKPVFRVTTSSGKRLKATADHEFMTKIGYAALSTLSVGDEVCVNPGLTQRTGGKKKTPYRKEVLVKYHPTARTKIVNGRNYHRLYVYQAIFEAHRNRLAYVDYIALLNGSDRAAVDACWTIPIGFDIHHVDENRENNEISNLRMVEHAEHAREHGGRGPLTYIEVEPIINIEPAGHEQVYDIACGDPYRNFVAGGVVVHNCGKTQAVEEIFRERDQRLEIVSCTPRTTANDLEGATDLVYEEGQQITKFTHASPALASEHGYGLLLDEADAAPSEAMYSMYRLLDGKPMRIVRKGYDGEVPLHVEFRAIGTQNTEGRGDDRGLYHGRSYQDEAFLDRWNAVIRVDYPSKENETLILRKRTAISGADAEKIVDVAIAMRNSQQADEIMFTCTMRRTLAVAENIAHGFDPSTAWALAVVNRATTEDRARIPEILNRIYGSMLRRKSPRKHKRSKPIAK